MTKKSKKCTKEFQDEGVKIIDNMRVPHRTLLDDGTTNGTWFRLHFSKLQRLYGPVFLKIRESKLKFKERFK